MSKSLDTPSLLLWPGPKRSQRNPYIGQFANAMANEGFAIKEFGLRSWRFGFGRSDAVLIHWPESAARTNNGLFQQLTFRLFLVTLTIFRRRGHSIVWLFHNASPHSKSGLPLGRFASKVDCLLSPSATGLRVARQLFPCLSSVPSGVSRLGVYPKTSIEVGRSSRSELGLRETSTVLLHFGHLRRYKGVEGLLNAVRQSEAKDLELVIVGDSSDEAYRSEILDAASKIEDPRLTLKLEFLAPEVLSEYLAAADGVVLPFTDVLHSSSMLLARSAGVPTLVPGIGSIPEYAALDPGIVMYTPPIDSGNLDKFIDKLTVGSFDNSGPLPDELQWDHIGSETASILSTIVGRPIHDRIEAR